MSLLETPPIAKCQIWVSSAGDEIWVWDVYRDTKTITFNVSEERGTEYVDPEWKVVWTEGSVATRSKPNETPVWDLMAVLLEYGYKVDYERLAFPGPGYQDGQGAQGYIDYETGKFEVTFGASAVVHIHGDRSLTRKL